MIASLDTRDGLATRTSTTVGLRLVKMVAIAQTRFFDMLVTFGSNQKFVSGWKVCV